MCRTEVRIKAMSQFELVIGNKNYSSWSLRPWLVLRHFRIPFTECRIPLYQGESKAALLEHSPSGRAPVLHDGTTTVWDSLAIIEYLAEKHAEKGIWPVDREARAIARAVSAEMHSGFEALRTHLPMNCRARGRIRALTEEAERDVMRVQEIWSSCRREFGNHGEWLFGDFSAADAMFAPVVIRFSGYGIRCDERGSAYVDFVLGHPALQEWMNHAQEESEIVEELEVGEERE
jgi:glutathione S-transferase